MLVVEYGSLFHGWNSPKEPFFLHVTHVSVLDSRYSLFKKSMEANRPYILGKIFCTPKPLASGTSDLRPWAIPTVGKPQTSAFFPNREGERL